MSLPPDVSTDYGPIVENAVAALGRNTADARREAYGRVRGIIVHHLRLSGLPDAIIGLETLALDLAISKIERQWRTHQAAAAPVRKTAPQHEARDIPTLEARPPLPPPSGQGSERRRRAEVSGRLTAILRPRAMRMGLAIALPIAVAVLIAVFAGNNLWYRGLPALPKSQDRLLAGSESAVSTPDAPPATGAASSLGPTKVRPVRADFGAVP